MAGKGSAVIIEKDGIINYFLSNTLKSLGYLTPNSYADPLDAILELDEQYAKPGIVIFDIGLEYILHPNHLSFFFFHLLGQPVLITSSLPNEDLSALFSRYPNWKFLAKPYNKQQLKSAVQDSILLKNRWVNSTLFCQS